ncbi:MAG: hypothetical protein LBD41_02845 [Clostridiales Family XIII bacterium]|jgi:hypothetical protein|nr:hypothetical protein [Clostridiales Family XIII bacterium]
MNTKINKIISDNRFKKTRKVKEIKLVAINTKKQIEALRQQEIKDNPPLLLELELAEIFKLDAIKTKKIVDEHNPKRIFSIASVMNDFETFLNMEKV